MTKELAEALEQLARLERIEEEQASLIQEAVKTLGECGTIKRRLEAFIADQRRTKDEGGNVISMAF